MNLSLNTPTNNLTMHVQNTGKIPFPFADLIFLQATGNYSWLHWKNGQRLLMPRTLKYYAARLPSELFVRTHRSCLINILYMERIEPIHPEKGGQVYLRSGDVLPISRRRWVPIKKLFLNLPENNYYAMTVNA